MSAVPVIPADVRTLDQLEDWIERAAPKAHTMPDRLRLTAAVMERAGEIGARRRAQREDKAWQA